MNVETEDSIECLGDLGTGNVFVGLGKFIDQWADICNHLSQVMPSARSCVCFKCECDLFFFWVSKSIISHCFPSQMFTLCLRPQVDNTTRPFCPRPTLPPASHSFHLRLNAHQILRPLLMLLDLQNLIHFYRSISHKTYSDLSPSCM